jgi:hypothetical protein
MISEIPYTCKMLVIIKDGHKVAGISLGRQETSVEMSSQEVLEEFWGTTEREISISSMLIDRSTQMGVVPNQHEQGKLAFGSNP